MTPDGINEAAYRRYNAAYVAARAAGRDDEDAHADAMYAVRQMQETAGAGVPLASHEGEAGGIIPASSLPTAGMEQGRLAGPISQTSPGSTPGPATKLALVAQMEERPARNGMVAGSMPAEGHIQAEAESPEDMATSSDTGTGTPVVIGSCSSRVFLPPAPVSPVYPLRPGA